MSWDMSFKDTAGTDFVVGQVWGQYGAKAYLLDQVRARLGFVATCDAFQKQANKWPGVVEKLVEDKANGPAVIDYLKNKVHGIIPIEPDGSKTSRAHAITPLFEAGNVLFPDKSIAPWVGELEQELANFPTDAHDDQVDALTQALRRMFKSRPMMIDAAVMARVEMDSKRIFSRGLQ
jgi:predicted phage terminase large subunit-like protein